MIRVTKESDGTTHIEISQDATNEEVLSTLFNTVFKLSQYKHNLIGTVDLRNLHSFDIKWMKARFKAITTPKAEDK